MRRTNKSYLFLLRSIRACPGVVAWQEAAPFRRRSFFVGTALLHTFHSKQKNSFFLKLPSVDSKFSLRNILARPKECELFTVRISFPIIVRETSNVTTQHNQSA